MPKKLTYNEVKNFVESRGYKLISERFEGSHSKIDVECGKGHIYPIGLLRIPYWEYDNIEKILKKELNI